MQKATLNTMENQACAVVVKSVLDDYSGSGYSDHSVLAGHEPNFTETMRLFFVEAATMCQFNHPNVQMLHGTVVRMNEAMVCVELASQGQLDNLMRDDAS